MNDFDVLSPFPFGWLELFIFYLSSILFFCVLHKIKVYVLVKNNLFFDFIYLSIVGFLGSV